MKAMAFIVLGLKHDTDYTERKNNLLEQRIITILNFGFHEVRKRFSSKLRVKLNLNCFFLSLLCLLLASK